MSHTKEPWEVVSGTDIYSVVGVERSSDGLKASGSDGWHIAECGNPNFTLVESGEEFSLAQKERKANARRIVACVNACSGITDEALQAVGKWSEAGQATLRELYALREQRDELLAALETIARQLPQIACERAQMMDYANKVIASVKGGAA